jgi:hypothetical protein
MACEFCLNKGSEGSKLAPDFYCPYALEEHA